MSFMRNEDFSSQSEGKSNGSGARRGGGSILERAQAAEGTTDGTSQRQEALDRQREAERAKGRSRMGGVLARASAKPTVGGAASSGGSRGSGSGGSSGGSSGGRSGRGRHCIANTHVFVFQQIHIDKFFQLFHQGFLLKDLYPDQRWQTIWFH